MNPPTSSSSQGGSNTTFVLGGGAGVGSVPYHTHPASAIDSGTLDNDLFPERLQAIGGPDVADADLEVETGWWSAGIFGANLPAASSWVGQTQRFTLNTLGDFAVQTAFEVVSPYRAYRRTLNIISWTAWKRLDPVSVGYRSTAANQTLTNNTFVTLNLGGTADHDIGSGFTKASDVVTITAAGTYRFDAAAYFNIATGNTRHVLYIESWTGADPGVGLGTQIAQDERLGTSVHYSAMGCGTTKTVAAGQKVRLIGFQAQGTNNTTLGATYPHQLNIQSVSV